MGLLFQEGCELLLTRGGKERGELREGLGGRINFILRTRFRRITVQDRPRSSLIHHYLRREQYFSPKSQAVGVCKVIIGVEKGREGEVEKTHGTPPTAKHTAGASKAHHTHIINAMVIN